VPEEVVDLKIDDPLFCPNGLVDWVWPPNKLGVVVGYVPNNEGGFYSKWIN